LFLNFDIRIPQFRGMIPRSEADLMRHIPWKSLFAGAALIALTATSSVGLTQEAPQYTEIKWRTDYVQARREALDKGLPLVIDFGTKTCHYCVLLDQKTFRDPQVIRVMNDRFVPLKIDAEAEVSLASKLQIASYPTIVLAGPDGTILGTMVGFKEAAEFHENLQRALAQVTSPDWMQRDLNMAIGWIKSGNYARAISALKTIVDDGKGRPAQASAAKLLMELEQKAGERLTKAKEMENKGQTSDAIEALTETIRVFPGLVAAKDAADRLATLAQRPEIRNPQRAKRARELLAQAKDFYKNREFIPCLDRCEVLVGSYGDLAEGQEGAQIVGEIKNNPEWLQGAADVMSDRLGSVYLALADALLKKNQPQQAEAQLLRVIHAFPGSRQAESAQIRLGQLQGLPARKVEIQNAGPP
jgi:thioredoxin-like negative regulator of GroEL